MTCFHEVEESHKRLFDLTLSKRALEFIEEDYLNMLQPMEVFQPLVPPGRYPSSDYSMLIADYYDEQCGIPGQEEMQKMYTDRSE